MRQLFNICIFALCLSHSGCSKDESIGENHTAKKNFDEMYPGATNIKWSSRSGHEVIRFNSSNRELEAWFDHSGSWKLTETEIPLTLLPSAVGKAFAQGDYSNWEIEDIDYVQRRDHDPIYVLEVELGEEEFDLYYTSDGTLVKAFRDSDATNDYLPKELPIVVSTYMEVHHRGFRLIDVEIEDGLLEIEFIENNTKMDIHFDNSGTWLRTSSKVTVNEFPKNLFEKLKASQYGAFRIDDVEFVETPSASFYILELESGETDLDLRISLDGHFERVFED